MLSLPLFGAFVIGALLLAFAYAITMFGEMLAHMVKGAPIIGDGLSNLILGSTGTASLWLIDHTKGDWAHVEQVIVAMGGVLFLPLEALLKVGQHHADQLHHIASALIPAAESKAAIHAHSLVTQEANRAGGQERKLSAAIAAATTTIAALRTYVNGSLSTSLRANASQDAAKAREQSYAHTDAAIKGMYSTLQTQLSNVWSVIKPLQATVTSTLPAEIAANATKAANEAAAAKQAAIARMQSQMTALGQSLQRAIATGNQATIATVTAATNKLQAELNTLQGTQVIDQAAVGKVTNEAEVALPALIAALAAQVAVLTNRMDNCMVTTCEGPNNIEKVLESIWGAYQTVGAVSYLAGAIAAPVPTAKATYPFLSTPVDMAVTLIHDILNF